MRMGLNIEYEGKSYDILELPSEAFLQMVPGLSEEQLKRLERQFQDYWPEATQRRHHILDFVAEQVGASVDYLLLNRETIRFHDADVMEYIEEHTKQGNRPS